MEYDYIIKLAKKASENSYAPYSKYKVGACVCDSEDNTYIGVNVENVCYALSMCAERNALASAVANGAEDLISIAIYHNGDELPYPCGACLQALSEFGENMEIIVACDTDMKIYNLKELLPCRFYSESLQA